jgi:hypothetical protein
MKKLICLMVVISFCGCAGRKPYPTLIHIRGDTRRNCNSITAEMTEIKLAQKELEPKMDKFWTNVFWFIWWPPMMDLKDAEKIEYNAYQKRYDYLSTLAAEKCTKGEDEPPRQKTPDKLLKKPPR